METPDKSNKVEKDFNQCPNCGSLNTIYEGEAKRMVSEGQAPEDFHYSMAKYQAPVANQQMIDQLPLMVRLPIITTILDVCADCGTVYVTKVIWDEIIKKPAPPPPTRLLTPNDLNRAARRRLERGN